MRAVLDSNILARAANNPRGPAGELLARFRTIEHVLIASPFILQELDRVLRYPRLRVLHRLSDEKIIEFVDGIANEASIVVTPVKPPALVPGDADDDIIVATAIAGQAEVLCTLDRHIRSPAVMTHCRQHGIDVLTDVELLARLDAPRSTP